MPTEFERTIYIINLPEGQKITGAEFDYKKARSVLSCMRVAANPELVKRLDEEVPRNPRTLK